MKSILCPIDFSPSSDVASQWAAKIAAQKGWQLVLFHKFLISEVIEKSDSKSGNVMEIARASATARISELKESLCNHKEFGDLNCITYVDYGFGFEDMILKVTKELAISMIIMGTNGADEISDIIFGSNTSNIIDKAGVPVLVIPESSSSQIPSNLIYATDLKNENEIFISRLLEFAYGLMPNLLILNFSKKGGKDMSIVKILTERLIKSTSEYDKYFQVSFESLPSEDLYRDLEKVSEERNALVMLGKQPTNLWKFITKGSFTRLMSLYSFVPVMILQKK